MSLQFPGDEVGGWVGGGGVWGDCVGGGGVWGSCVGGGSVPRSYTEVIIRKVLI